MEFFYCIKIDWSRKWNIFPRYVTGKKCWRYFKAIGPLMFYDLLRHIFPVTFIDIFTLRSIHCWSLVTLQTQSHFSRVNILLWGHGCLSLSTWHKFNGFCCLLRKRQTDLHKLEFRNLPKLKKARTCSHKRIFRWLAFWKDVTFLPLPKQKSEIMIIGHVSYDTYITWY